MSGGATAADLSRRVMSAIMAQDDDDENTAWYVANVDRIDAALFVGPAIPDCGALHVTTRHDGGADRSFVVVVIPDVR